MVDSPTPDIAKNVAVRSFEARDQAAVSRLYGEGLLAGQIAPNDTGADIDNIVEAYFDDPRNHFWVADSDGEVLGMIGVAADDEHIAEIRRLRVEKRFQNTEIAGLLIEIALAHCKQNGYLKIRLDTRFDPDTVVDVFDRFGFQHTRTKEVPGKELLEFYLDLYRQPKNENE